MNESIGYSVTINIIITFIVITFVFISNVLIFYKSNKVGKVITDSIEKNGGFNVLSKTEIDMNLESIGYNKTRINCSETISDDDSKTCEIVDKEETINKGYCVYLCDTTENNYYYKVKTNMIINIPIINNIINATVFERTGNIYDFGNGKENPEPIVPS